MNQTAQVMPAPIEHPAKIGRLNCHILGSMTRAYRCALDLSERGFTVLEVTVSGRNPIVQIQACEKVNEFPRAFKVIRCRGHGVMERHMVTIVHDCQVQWTDRS